MIFKNPNRLVSNKIPSRKVIFLLAGVIAFILLVIAVVSKIPSSTSVGSNNSSVQVQSPKSTKTLNKDFAFPIKNDKGEEISKLKYTLTEAQLTNEIVVKGQKATTTPGRIFLTINIKITNDTNKKIQIDTRDYVRLLVNNNDKEFLPPTIHNDPVEIQPISTTYTRLGFALNVTDKKHQLRVGEINGDKTTIDLNF